MKRSSIVGLLAATALVPVFAQASTVTTNLLYSADNIGLDGGSPAGFNAFTTTDIGVAKLRFGARASSGEVDADASISFSTHFERDVDLANASTYSVDFGLNGLSFGYDAFTGAEAGAFVDFDPIFGVNPGEFRVIGDDYTLETSDSRTGFGSTGNERALSEIAGVGPDLNLVAIATRAVVTLDASKTTSMSVSDLQGNLVAVHESGAVVSDPFALNAGPQTLDLSLAGEWSLQLRSVALRNQFNSATGISAGYEIGIATGETFGGCGDYSTDDDNENTFIPPSSCIGDAGNSGNTSQLSLLDPAPFEIDWGRKFVDLGTVTVRAAPPPPGPGPEVVPLPAGLPLILTGLLGFVGLRRMQRRASA